jgi:peptide/nickel transport system substrate-binding protein
VLIDRVKVDTKPFSLTYHLKPEARWSDGVPVSADDLLFTLETLRNPANNIVSRQGYDRIVEAVRVDGKTAKLVFSEPYAAWKSLFPQVLPKHVLEGQDFNTALLDSIPVASGPFELRSWQHGTQLTLVRNDDWWGPNAPDLDRVVLRFIPSVTDQVEALLAGELTAIHPFASAPLAPLQGAPGIAFESGPGLTMEHLDFNTDSATMPLLHQSWFRQAVAYALDRETALDYAWGPLTLDVEPLDSLVYLRQQKEYKPVFDRYRYDPSHVAKIMKRHNCVLAPDGIWSCRGTRASVSFATTSGNARRAYIQEQLVMRARVAGIELVPDNSPPAVLFGTRLPAGDFELTMFAWLRTVDPFGLGNQYGCGGAQNYMRYCSPKVTDLLEAADEEVNHPANLLHRAGAILGDDVPSIPFYQQPLFLAYRTELQGIELNAGPQSLTWNVVDWRIG